MQACQGSFAKTTAERFGRSRHGFGAKEIQINTCNTAQTRHDIMDQSVPIHVMFLGIKYAYQAEKDTCYNANDAQIPFAGSQAVEEGHAMENPSRTPKGGNSQVPPLSM